MSRSGHAARAPLPTPVLLAGLAALMCACGASHASQRDAPIGFRGETGAAVYTDDDDLRVLSPHLTATQDVAGPMSVRAEMRADVISSASVDIVTSATKGFEEKRFEGALAARYEDGGLSLEAGYIGSTESDTTTHLLAASGTAELLDRHLTLALGYSLGLDRLGEVHEPRELWEPRTVHRVDLSASPILGPATVLLAGYTFQLMEGSLSSPYRQVPLFPSSSAFWDRGHAQWVDERHPDRRARHALTLRLRQALGMAVFLSAGWRGYLDTWSMRSHTGEAGVGVDLGGGLTLELLARTYWQSSVSFYRAVYTVNREYLTRDRRLAKMLTESGRLDLRWRLGIWEILARGELRWTRYDDFRGLYGDELRPLETTWAGVFQLALAMEL